MGRSRWGLQKGCCCCCVFWIPGVGGQAGGGVGYRGGGAPNNPDLKVGGKQGCLEPGLEERRGSLSWLTLSFSPRLCPSRLLK